LDKRNQDPAGGPHPHAGFETVSLLLDGEIREQMESMKKGDFQVMTAGSGTVHTETIDEPTKGRLLQLWLNLPFQDRWVQPRLQVLDAGKVPVVQKEGVTIRLYSGQLDGVVSPIKNYTPLFVAELEMKGYSEAKLPIGGDYNAFVYVIGGAVAIGDETLHKDQVGWLNQTEETSQLVIQAKETDARLVVYAAKPTRDEIVSHGPFIAGSEDEIRALYRQYRSGTMLHISNAPETQRLIY
ncbi:MAG: pirin family protein, partial [Azospira oryzae]